MIRTALTIASALALSSEALAEEAAHAKILRHHEVTEIEIEVIVFDRPLHFSFGIPENPADSDRVWYEPFKAIRRWGEYDFDDWVEYHSPDFQQMNNIVRERFEEMKPEFDLTKEAHEFESVMFEYRLKFSGRELIVLVNYAYGFLEEAPISPLDLDYGFAVNVFEKLDGVWKNQHYLRLDQAAWLRFSNRNTMQAMIDAVDFVTVGRSTEKLTDVYPPPEVAPTD